MLHALRYYSYPKLSDCERLSSMSKRPAPNMDADVPGCRGSYPRLCHGVAQTVVTGFIVKARLPVVADCNTKVILRSFQLRYWFSAYR